MKSFKLVAFLLPSLLLSGTLESKNNYLFSYYKPSKKVFIKKAKDNYLYNSDLQRIYAEPMANPKNALIYAIAMDYVYSDASEDVKEAYKIAAFSIGGANGFNSILQYADFLIRTKRYSDVISINPKQCGRDAPQCIYYKVVAKHLSKKDISKEECSDAMLFLPMQKMTLGICE